MITKALGLVAGVGTSALALVHSASAAAPTSFSTTTAVSVLDQGYDTFIEMITAVVPILLPVFAVVGFILFVWGFGKGLVRPK